MAFVYRYLSRQGNTQYIGKVSGDSMDNLTSRIRQHKQDFGGREESWTIEYIDGLSAADADALETILIAQLKPVLNKSKTQWGNCHYFSEVSPQWKLYDPSPKFGRSELNNKHKRGDDDIHKFECDCCHTVKTERATWIFVDIKGPGHWYGTGATVCRSCADFLVFKHDELFCAFLSRFRRGKPVNNGLYAASLTEVPDGLPDM